ncbi:MAG: ABC transporter ATP-binding protein [Acidimicrobiales bacterium]
MTHHPAQPAADRPELIANVAGVSRWFGEVQALTNLTIEVPKGAITVLLGPNGAGKTTAIRMITGALAPQEGTVEVFGLDPARSRGEEVRRRCGVVSAKPSLYDRLDGWDNLRYAAELYGLGRGSNADRRIAEAAHQFGIDAALDHQVGGYSTGMKTRLRWPDRSCTTPTSYCSTSQRRDSTPSRRWRCSSSSAR